MKARLIVAALALAAACTPPAPSTTETAETPAVPGAPGTASPEQDALATALAPVLSADIGTPVRLSVQVSRTQNDFGWLVGQPWTADGAALDWSTTRYAERAREGALDGNGTTYALLKRENGQWRVLEFAVGPTDVAWAGWAEEHGAPEALFATQ